ncbi:sulfite exporter TauE/SafE family protein [Salinicola peritrichatus]|uniref:sulfite exporter TauE/SafE family protein n=1 Tax=Salinicola peritrichatus TaxID=1267424 RepID=UPI000DA202B2|nr:sulfite exporter TauE/SafE family protein [Salinicola peritrichatus]
MLFSLLLLGCGLLAGMTTILFGFGGGFAIVPLLYHLYGASNAAMPTAVATSAAVMVFTASWASYRQARAGNLEWARLRPLLLPMALGAGLGALLAPRLDDDWLRWAFVIYLLVTIVDCLRRRHFLSLEHSVNTRRLPAPRRSLWSGLLIGGVSSLLGVGGSVMTVPMMRRAGLPMVKAAAMANPLTLPIALSATLAYAVQIPPASRPGMFQIGLVDVGAGTALALGALLGIQAALPLAAKLADGLHARIYLALLAAVALSMAL